MFTDLVNHNNILLKMILLALLNGFWGTTIQNANTQEGKSQSVIQKGSTEDNDEKEESQYLIN